MKIRNTKFAALALAIPCGAMAVPALAAPAFEAPIYGVHANLALTHGDTVYDHRDGDDRDGDYRGRWHGREHDDRDYRGYRGDRGYRGYHQVYYGEPVYRDTRIWRGNDGRYYCRRENGTTGLLVGAVVGGVIGSEVAERGDRTLGAILGAAGGAILGRSIDRSNARCR